MLLQAHFHQTMTQWFINDSFELGGKNSAYRDVSQRDDDPIAEYKIDRDLD